MDSSIYVQDTLNTTTIVVLQVLCHYEFMIEMSLLMPENQVKKSISYMTSPHLPQLGEGASHSYLLFNCLRDLELSYLNFVYPHTMEPFRFCMTINMLSISKFCGSMS